MERNHFQWRLLERQRMTEKFFQAAGVAEEKAFTLCEGTEDHAR